MVFGGSLIPDDIWEAIISEIDTNKDGNVNF